MKTSEFKKYEFIFKFKLFVLNLNMRIVFIIFYIYNLSFKLHTNVI